MEAGPGPHVGPVTRGSWQGLGETGYPGRPTHSARMRDGLRCTRPRARAGVDETPAHALLAGVGSVSSCWPLSAACPFSDRLSPRTAGPARGPWLGLRGLPTRQEPFSSQLGPVFSYK